MNEILNTIKTRFSCRDYTGAPVESNKLEALVKAALQAPSALNLQPWELIVIKNKSLIDKLNDAALQNLKANDDKTAYNRIMERGGKVYYNAPCMILVLKAPDSAPRSDLDCGILVQNIALAASSLCLGSVIAAMTEIPFTGEAGAEYRKSVGWKDGYTYGIGILVGYVNSGKDPHEINLSKVSYVD